MEFLKEVPPGGHRLRTGRNGFRSLSTAVLPSSRGSRRKMEYVKTMSFIEGESSPRTDLPRGTGHFVSMEDARPENGGRETRIRRIRLGYSLGMCLLVVLAAFGAVLHIRAFMNTRGAMILLKKVRSAEQLEKMLPIYGKNLTDDQLAEILSHCALEEFGAKNYPVCIRLLKKIVESRAHSEYRAAAALQMANTCLLAGDNSEGTAVLNALIGDPETPEVYKNEALRIREKYSK